MPVRETKPRDNDKTPSEEMMNHTGLSRRNLLLAGAGLAGAVSTLSPAAFAQENTRMRMFWWGSKERGERTIAANQLFVGKNAGVTIDGEMLGWNDYWPRMATQAAARNLADVIQMDYRYLSEYSRRGALRPLDEYMPGILDIADFGANSIDCGRVEGKLYGVNLGNNSFSMLMNKTLFEEHGIALPRYGTTWAQFGELCSALGQAVNKSGFGGSADAGGQEPGLEAWVRQRGKALYDNDGKLGYAVDDLAEWLAFWDGLRKTKGCVPAEVQALDKNNIETASLTNGKSATAFAHSNQMVAYQGLNQDELEMGMYPVGEKPGQYLKPSMMLSVSTNSKNPELAAKLINFWVKDPLAVRVLGVERGIPPSPASREVAKETLNDLGKAVAAYVAFVSDKVGALPPPPPKGAGEIEVMLRKTNELVGFGQMTAMEAAKRHVEDAIAILARAA
jgi:multiple sugar transport system substrate-binding protein